MLLILKCLLSTRYHEKHLGDAFIEFNFFISLLFYYVQWLKFLYFIV